MQNKLLPCPFCGGEAELMFTEIGAFEPKVWENENDTGVLFFQCYGCDSVFTHDEPISTAKKMIEWWNTRKPMERIVEQLEEKSNDIPIQYENNYEQGYANGIDYAIEIVKGGVDNAE